VGLTAIGVRRSVGIPRPYDEHQNGERLTEVPATSKKERAVSRERDDPSSHHPALSI
jgi:hypothetical protein